MTPPPGDADDEMPRPATPADDVAARNNDAQLDGEPEGSADPAGAVYNPFARTRYRRAGLGLEFDRLCFFSDAVFAIALTIIVVGIDGPQLHNSADSSELVSHLGDLAPSILIFFVSFMVIGRYWVANHHFMAAIGEIDGLFMGTTVVYLSIIAFLPFPASILGDHASNPVAVAFFAMALAAVSALETVLLIIAQRHALFRGPLEPDAYRWTLVGSWSPVGVMVLSVPIAFLSPTLAIVSWFLASPIGYWLNRKKPAQILATS